MISLPKECNIRMIKLQETMGLPLLMSNQGIFVTPKVVKLTVVCNESTSPRTLIIENTGKLTLKKNCKAYNANTVIYANTVLETNITMDFIPKVDLNFYCCLNFEKHKQFQEIPLEIPLKNILTFMGDLRSTSLSRRFN